MEITKYLTTRNFTASTSKTNKYIVIHYTANNGDTAMNNAVYFETTYRGASAHYFVDENEIVQVVEDYNTAWHCGTTGTYLHSTCRNSNSIGIEMCSRIDSEGNYYIKDDIVATTIELVKYLQNLYNIPNENVIRHYEVTGKICPAPMVYNSTLWSNFKEALDESNEIVQEQDEEEEEMRYNQISEIPDYTDFHDCIKTMVDNGYLTGSGGAKDSEGYPTDLDLSYDMIRVFVINYRAGMYR